VPLYDDFVQLIASLAEAPPERGARLVDGRFRETFHPYVEISARVRVLAAQFLSEGVRRGQRVLVALPTEIDAIASFLALVYLGAVPFSISSPLLGQARDAHRRQMLNLIRLHGIDRLVSSRDLTGIAGSAPEAPAGMEITPAGHGPGDLREPPDVEAASVSPEDVAYVQFSSGSTSHPKGIPITHRAVVTNAQLIADNDRRTGESVWVSWLPLYHDMGLVGGLLSNFLLKNDLVQMHPLCFMARPISWLAAISERGGTTTAIPNFALEHCVDRVTDEQLEERSIDLGTLRYIYNGAEPVRPASLRRFEERFGPWGFGPGRIYPVYGMSETTLIITAPDHGHNLRTREVAGVEVSSVGRPLGDFALRIRDEEGADLGPDEIGEIWVKGACVTPGYLTALGNEEEVIEEGWLPTGDLGLLDGEGRLYITGRKKDLIIHQGRNFYGHDIAAHLEELPFVRKGKVFVFETEVEGGNRVIVMTAPPRKTGETPPDAESFRASLIKAVLREFGLPVHDVLVVSSIPKTTSGKVARHRCEEIYREARLKGSSREEDEGGT